MGCSIYKYELLQISLRGDTFADDDTQVTNHKMDKDEACYRLT